MKFFEEADAPPLQWTPSRTIWVRLAAEEELPFDVEKTRRPMAGEIAAQTLVMGEAVAERTGFDWRDQEVTWVQRWEKGPRNLVVTIRVFVPSRPTIERLTSEIQREMDPIAEAQTWANRWSADWVREGRVPWEPRSYPILYGGELVSTTTTAQTYPCTHRRQEFIPKHGNPQRLPCATPGCVEGTRRGTQRHHIAVRNSPMPNFTQKGNWVTVQADPRMERIDLERAEHYPVDRSYPTIFLWATNPSTRLGELREVAT